MPDLHLGAKHQDLKLHYDVHGSGSIKILFIMGLLADGEAWMFQTNFFRQKSEYQCVNYDNRGCNRSSTPSTLHYSTVQMAKDAQALIDHLEWGQCHVVGVSMGGMIALELAIIAPERILSLALLATHAGGRAGQAPSSGMRHILRAGTIRDRHRSIENAMEMLYASKTLIDQEQRQTLYRFHSERLDKRIPPTPMGIVGQMLAVYRHYVSYTDLLKIRFAPFDCLIIVGNEDRLVRESNSYHLKHVLGCRLIKIADAGHGLYSEHANIINDELFNMYESIRINGSTSPKQVVPQDNQLEIQALEKCCQHRTHCFVHDLFGLIQGSLVGLFIYLLLLILGLVTVQLAIISFSFRSALLLGYVNGLRRGIACVYHALRARQFVQEHRLQLDRATDHGGVDVTLAQRGRTGIPAGCGFEFPLSSMLFNITMFGLILFNLTGEQQIF